MPNNNLNVVNVKHTDLDDRASLINVLIALRP